MVGISAFGDSTIQQFKTSKKHNMLYAHIQVIVIGGISLSSRQSTATTMTIAIGGF